MQHEPPRELETLQKVFKLFTFNPYRDERVNSKGIIELEHDIPAVQPKKDVTRSVQIVGMDKGIDETLPKEDNEHYDPGLGDKKDVSKDVKFQGMDDFGSSSSDTSSSSIGGDSSSSGSASSSVVKRPSGTINNIPSSGSDSVKVIDIKNSGSSSSQKPHQN